MNFFFFFPKNVIFLLELYISFEQLVLQQIWKPHWRVHSVFLERTNQAKISRSRTQVRVYTRIHNIYIEIVLKMKQKPMIRTCSFIIIKTRPRKTRSYLNIIYYINYYSLQRDTQLRNCDINNNNKI